MIHHLSVSARNPKDVAEFFADLIGGVAIEFPPNPGGYMSFAPDKHGTGVEVYPAGSVMLQNGEEGAIFGRRAVEAVDRSPTHFALSVLRSGEEVMALARSRGWDCFTCDRGGDFHVIEVWVENAWLLEALPPAFAEEYLLFTDRVLATASPATALETHEPQAATLQLV
jgi:hypothetical protein